MFKGRVSESRHAHRLLWAIASSLLTLAVVLAWSPTADALKTTERAAPRVKKWASPKSYTTAYAFVKIVHDGRALPRMPISGCKGTYADEDLTVLISTCGKRWKVRANYVSMSGDRERFQIVYDPRRSP